MNLQKMKLLESFFIAEIVFISVSTASFLFVGLPIKY